MSQKALKRIPDVLLENFRSVVPFHAMYWGPPASAVTFRSAEEFEDARQDWRAALALFLGKYAYARNINLSAYAAAAESVAKGLPKRSTPSARTKADAWEAFDRNLPKELGRNPKLNPLAVDGSVIDLCAEVPEYNLVEWTRRQIVRSKIGEAHARLRAVRGIGNKIASFWLRDIADAFTLTLKDADRPDEVLLQPIDIWVYRAAQVVAPVHQVKLPRTPSDGAEDAARIIIHLAAELGVRHTLLNTAIWTFGAQMVGGWEADLINVLGTRHGTTRLLDGIQNWCEAVLSCTRTHRVGTGPL